VTPEERRDLRESLSHALMPLGREIGELKVLTRTIDDTLRQKQIEDAALQGKQSAEMTEVRNDINGIGKKISLHIADHWKWLLGTTAIVGTIMAAAKFLAGN